MNQAQVCAQVFLSARETVHVRVRSLVSQLADSQISGDAGFKLHGYFTEGLFFWEQVSREVRAPIWDEAHEYVRGRA